LNILKTNKESATRYQTTPKVRTVTRILIQLYVSIKMKENKKKKIKIKIEFNN